MAAFDGRNSAIGTPEVAEVLMYTTMDGREMSEGDVKQLVGGAISRTAGILAMYSGVVDMFKQNQDVSRGVTVKLLPLEKQVKVKAGVIVDAAYNVDDVLDQAKRNVAATLAEETGLELTDVEVTAEKTMTRAEFDERCDAERLLV